MTAEEFQNIAATIPHQPGIYKYFDKSGEILYVGKAKDLRKRVGSYFTKTFTGYKTHELVRRINHIEFMIVNSEQDAFLLENTLIKQYQPRFNINLKDDKSYPFIVIKKEPFPRVFLTRKKLNDGSEYLGPYTSVKKVRELLNFIKQTIQLRSCSLNLTENNIKKKKFKLCLEYHLGNCKGPCEGLQTTEDYDESLVQLKNLLRGNLAPVIRHFKKEMAGHAETLEFEKAEQIRSKISFLENYQSKSVVANAVKGDMDVFSLLKENNIAYVNYLMVRNGTVIQTQTSKVESKLDETEEELLVFSIVHMRATFNSDAREIIVPFRIDFPQNEILVTVPRAGDKKKLLDLSQKNVSHFIEELKNKKRINTGTAKKDKHKILEQLQADLQLKDFPGHIECFDNSNFQGSFPVSAMVCFRNGEPSKQDYRRFNIKTVKGINDFASMKETVYRRYKRLLEEEQDFPQLIVIDGGKGQLNAAREAIIELNALGKTTLVGLAKNEEEIFFSGDSIPLKLPYNSESLKLIRRIRDEVHRFGITFHRQKRSKGTFKNELEDIPGIGKNTADQLLKAFRSVKNIRKTELGELEKLVGKAKAKLVLDHFQKNK
ncbi:MAG TPA: excinuclease ABC subunit UvrC [Chitinophagaceae bacterium]|nr:excinuclease ABC subunit C [Chitinophagaceae bacterium]HRX93377.1 excinuclease ABC subunit UvrC [Chitinophagaceae bacterium]